MRREWSVSGEIGLKGLKGGCGVGFIGRGSFEVGAG